MAVISSKITLYVGNTISSLGRKTVSKVITNLDDYNNIILIAHRLSNRGINYVNTNYSRYLTHQISIVGKSVSNFIQRCRILGNKPHGTKEKFYLTCINSSKEEYDKIVNKVDSFDYTKFLQSK